MDTSQSQPPQDAAQRQDRACRGMTGRPLYSRYIRSAFASTTGPSRLPLIDHMVKYPGLKEMRLFW